MFLKRACAMQWTFKMMAEFMCKNSSSEKTRLELIVEKTKQISTDQQSFWYYFNELLNDKVH